MSPQSGVTVASSFGYSTACHQFLQLVLNTKCYDFSILLQLHLVFSAPLLKDLLLVPSLKSHSYFIVCAVNALIYVIDMHTTILPRVDTSNAKENLVNVELAFFSLFIQR
jgi:hypothetical protein